MKREDFLDAVGQIDERYIEEAASSGRRVSPAKIIRPLAFLAAAVVLFFGVRFVFRTIRPESGNADKEIITNGDAEGPGNNGQKSDAVPNRTEETREEGKSASHGSEPGGAVTTAAQSQSLTPTEKEETDVTEDAATFSPPVSGPDSAARSDDPVEERNTEAAESREEETGEGKDPAGKEYTEEVIVAPGENITGEDISGDLAFLENRSRDVSSLIHIETADCPWKAEDFLLYLSSSDVMVVSIKAEAYDGTVLEPVCVYVDDGGNDIGQLYQIPETIKDTGGLAEGETFAYALVYDDEGLLNLLHPLELVYQPEEMSEAMKKLADIVN